MPPGSCAIAPGPTETFASPRRRKLPRRRLKLRMAARARNVAESVAKFSPKKNRPRLPQKAQPVVQQLE